MQTNQSQTLVAPVVDAVEWSVVELNVLNALIAVAAWMFPGLSTVLNAVGDLAASVVASPSSVVVSDQSAAQNGRGLAVVQQNVHCHCLAAAAAATRSVQDQVAVAWIVSVGNVV